MESFKKGIIQSMAFPNERVCEFTGLEHVEWTAEMEYYRV